MIVLSRVTTYPHLMLRSRMNRSHTPLPLVTCMVVAGQCNFFITNSAQFMSVITLKKIRNVYPLEYRHSEGVLHTTSYRLL
jgi:hypothetical protein